MSQNDNFLAITPKWYFFAKKVLVHPEHRNIFQFMKNNRTRSGKIVVVPTCKNARYEKSTVPALAKIINNKFTHKI